MNKLRMETPDLTSQNIDKIAALFPNCVTEMRDENGKLKRGINFEMLKQMLSPDVVDGDECYEFTWVGKKASIVEANKPIRKTLRPCPEESKNWDTTENLYIEGDNLEVLKLLQEAYLGKVKMIYIDPPYNTGNDFIYADDFMRSQKEENEKMGMYDEDENRLFKNTDTNGKFHSDWCSMMYSRLMLARNLLADDGAIFISIDDGEVENLKKMCDEVFGANNCICRFGWETKKAAQGMTTANMIVDNQESILVYAKNTIYFRFRGLDRDETNGFSNPDNDFRGLWKRQYLQRLGQGLPVRTITDPATGNVFSFETPYTQEKLNRWIEEKKIIFPSDPTKYPARKEFLCEYENRQQLVSSLGLYATKATTEKLYNLFDGCKIFTNPKPETLVRFIVQQCTDNAQGIIFDFFSGSATTAHAVMQLNAEDGGHRKFIMVQLPEPCDEKSEAFKAGYKNICEIGKERIRRAGRQILERSFESLEKEGLIEKYAGELSEIRSLEEVYGVGSAGVPSHQAVATGGDLRIGRPNAAGSRFDSVEYCGGTVAGKTGVYPVFASGKGITSGAGNTIVTLRSLAVLNELGYRVCLERFRGDQQNALLPDQISKLQALNAKLSLDTGFRVLKLDDSNMKDVYYAADDYDQQNLVDMISNIKEDRTDLDLLFGCLLDWGVPLSMPYTSEQIDGCTVHTYNDGDLIACFDANVPESVVKEIAKRKPLRAVFRDSSFADSPSKINVFEIFKLYMPEDADDISKRVRVI